MSIETEPYIHLNCCSGMKNITCGNEYEPFVIVNNGEYHFCQWCWEHEGKETIESDYMTEKIVDIKFINTFDEYVEYERTLKNGNLND